MVSGAGKEIRFGPTFDEIFTETFHTWLLVLTRLYATHQFDLRGKRTIAGRHSVSSYIGGRRRDHKRSWTS